MMAEWSWALLTMLHVVVIRKLKSSSMGFLLFLYFSRYSQTLKENCLFQQEIVKMGPCLSKGAHFKVSLGLSLIHLLLRA